MEQPGYLVATDHLETFSKGLDSAGTRCDNCGAQVPAFSGWELVPGTGMPVVGLLFASEYNRCAEVFQEAMVTLAEALSQAHQKLDRVALAYEKTEAANAVSFRVAG